MTTLVFQQRLVAWIWHCASMEKKFLCGLEAKHLSWLGAQAQLTLNYTPAMNYWNLILHAF